MSTMAEPEVVLVLSSTEEIVATDPVKTHREKGDPLGFSCPACGKKFDSSRKLQQHEKTHSGKERHECPICGKTYLHKSYIKQHMKTHSGVKYACDMCESRFTQQSALCRHRNSIHFNVRRFECTQCGKRFVDNFNLMEHVKTHYKDVPKPYNCTAENCPEIFHNRLSLNEHVHLHFCKEPESCPRCIGKQRAKTEKKNRIFYCSYCERTFNRTKGLDIHLRLHYNEFPYHCECGKRFRQKNQLASHVRVHTGEKPYPCNVCGRDFRRRSTLRDHMNIHLDKKPLLCGLCGKRFRQHSCFKLHLNNHAGKKRFSCRFCKKKYLYEETLKEHLMTHSESKEELENPSNSGFIEKRERRKKKVEESEESKGNEEDESTPYISGTIDFSEGVDANFESEGDSGNDLDFHSSLFASQGMLDNDFGDDAGCNDRIEKICVKEEIKNE